MVPPSRSGRIPTPSVAERPRSGSGPRPTRSGARSMRGRWFFRMGVLTTLALVAPGRAEGPRPSPQAAPGGALPVPLGLPRYDIDLRIDPAAREVAAREWVTFTNREGVVVTKELVDRLIEEAEFEDAGLPPPPRKDERQ